MKKLIVFIACLVFSAIPTYSFSDSGDDRIVVTHAVGIAFVGNSGKGTMGKLNSIGYSHTLFKGVNLVTGVGAWTDFNIFDSNYTFFSYVGLEAMVESDRFYTKVSISPAIISDVNHRLSTNLQFLDQIGFGFKNDYMRMGFAYKHFSNGSIKLPNLGQDYLAYEIHFDI